MILSGESMKRIAILGSTGSIGKSSLKIVEAFPDRFSVVSLAAGGNVDLAFEQARRWHPKIVSMASAEAADHLQDKLKRVGLGHSTCPTDRPGRSRSRPIRMPIL